MTETAKVYGESLYELAHDESISGDIQSELEEIVQLFHENPMYEKLLVSPAVPKDERCAALDESLGGRVHPYILNFLKILVENGTIRELSGCLEAYRDRYNEDNGIVAATAVTAVKLGAAERERLCAKLSEVTGKKVLLRERVDPSVLGGIRVEMAGKRYDGTVLGRLEEIQKSLDNTVL